MVFPVTSWLAEVFSSKQRNFYSVTLNWWSPRCKILELPFFSLGIFVNTPPFSVNIEFYCGNFQACVPLLNDLIISPACGNWETLPSRPWHWLFWVSFSLGCNVRFWEHLELHFYIIFMSWVFTYLFCSMLQFSFTYVLSPLLSSVTHFLPIAVNSSLRLFHFICFLKISLLFVPSCVFSSLFSLFFLPDSSSFLCVFFPFHLCLLFLSPCFSHISSYTSALSFCFIVSFFQFCKIFCCILSAVWQHFSGV